MEVDRAEAKERLEAQRMEYESRLGELEVELVKKKKEVKKDRCGPLLYELLVSSSVYISCDPT